MFPKPLAFAAVAAGCITAAGVGAYVATRQVAAPTSAAPALVADATGSAAQPGVIETEGLVTTAPSGALAGTEATATTPTPSETTASSATAAPAPVPSSAPRVERERPAPARPAAQPERTSRRTEPSRGESRDTGVRPTPRPTPEPVRPEPTEPVAPVVPPPVFEPARDSARVDPEFPALPTAPESRPAPREPEKEFEELIVSADSVIGLQIERTVSSDAARVEDRVEARVSRDVRVGGAVAIPAGSKMQGSVTLVDRGGKVKERARLGIRFHTLVLSDGTQVPMRTETIYREGESPVGESSAKIGGAAVGGAILGAIMGGRKGAAVGGSIGAAGGTAAVMAGGRNAAVMQSGSTVTVRMSEPVSVTVEKPSKE